MVTHFITVEIELQSAAHLHRAIIAELQKQGEPLRWAIVSIDTDRQKVQIEAVITTPTAFPVPPIAVRTV